MVQVWKITDMQAGRQADRQTNSLTPYEGMQIFFQLNLLPPYSFCSQGDKDEPFYKYSSNLFFSKLRRGVGILHNLAKFVQV